MTETYAAKVLADSIAPNGARVTTIEATFPRFLLAEFNTHRLFSRNSASSRAIPTEQMIERVRAGAFVPETFNARVKGMGVGEGLSTIDQDNCRKTWLSAAEMAATYASDLNELGIDKSRANRLLEPFLWHTAIVTSTDWDNFRYLRQPMEGDVPNIGFPAQPEMQIIARRMMDVLDISEPLVLLPGQWHLPKVVKGETQAYASELWDRLQPGMLWPHVSSGRCAKVSYNTQDNEESARVSAERSLKLSGSAHWSPMEHPCRPLVLEDLDDPKINNKILVPMEVFKRNLGEIFEHDLADIWCGNLRGFIQLRKFYEFEHNAALSS